MYSLGMLLGTIMAIYAYRIYQGKVKRTTFIIFALSSLAVAYTHYYGLMLAGVVNLLLFVYLIKNVKTRKQDLIKFIISAVIQVILYMPWLISFIAQLTGFGGFWITLTFPNSFYEILTTQYRGNLETMPVVLTTAFYAYILYIASKVKKEERKPGTWAILLYIAIIIIALLVSALLHSVILLFRYLLIVTGILVFGLAFFMAKDTNKWRVAAVCIVILLVSSYSNIIAIKQNYNSTNRDFMAYLEENVQEGDIIVYSNAISGAVITTELSNIKENNSYFYNKEHWGVHEAYKAFNMIIKEDLDEIIGDYSGRILLVEGGTSHELYEEISEKYNVTKLDEQYFEDSYKGYQYTFEIISKD